MPTALVRGSGSNVLTRPVQLALGFFFSRSPEHITRRSLFSLIDLYLSRSVSSSSSFVSYS